jgi:trimeric autotransporter adhesin
MKQLFAIAAIAFCVCPGTFSQTKMIINKNDGTSDSLSLSEIKNITFKTYGGTVIPEGPTAGLVAYYPFSGDANDQSQHGFDGVTYGALLTNDRFGNPFSAYFFDGSSYISFGDVLDSVFCKDVAQFSVSGWTKPSTVVTNGIIFAKSAGGAGPYQWSVTFNNNEIALGFCSDSTAQNFLTQFIHANTNVWHHFVMVFDGTLPTDKRIRVYVDTASVVVHFNGAGSVGTNTQNTTQELTVGGFKKTANSAVDNAFIGVVDDLRIYNRPLTFDEIVALYNAKN